MKNATLLLVKKILSHELISGSAYLFVGTTLGNIFAFIFNLLLVRKVSYVQYAEISSIISLMTLITIPSIAFPPTIIQFAGKYFAKNQKEKAAELFWQASIKIGLVAGALFILFILFAPFLANFLHIANTWEVVIAGFVVSAVYLTITNTAFLQSLLKFGFLSFTLSLTGALKLLLGIGLISLGFGTIGLLWGFFIAFFIPLCITFVPLGYLVTLRFKKKATIHNKEILLYGLPTTIAMFALSSFTSTDILLVKHFFPNNIAALYSGISLIGRIIFYFSSPIAMVMFPLITKRFHKGENTTNLLSLSFLLVLVPSLCLTSFYFLFPKFVITIILGSRYFAVAPFLGWFGLYLSIFSLLNVIINFFLSIKKIQVAWIIALGALLQTIGITLFHKSIGEVIGISLVLSLVLFILLLLYYQHTYATFQKEKK